VQVILGLVKGIVNLLLVLATSPGRVQALLTALTRQLDDIISVVEKIYNIFSFADPIVSGCVL
jgi:hypothetical protein